MAGLINFEDEQEVKQFLDNLGVEYSYQCHREKDPEGWWSAVPLVLVLNCFHSRTIPLFLLFTRVSEVSRLLGGCEEEL